MSTDYEPVRSWFPWLGLVNSGEQGPSARYREIMAEARRGREIVKAIDPIPRPS